MTRFRHAYDAQKAFVAQATARAQLWRVLVMTVGFLLAFVLAPQIVASVLIVPAMAEAYYDGVTPLATLAQFATFGVAGVIFVVLLQLVHRRGFRSLTGPRRQMLDDLRKVALAVGLLLLVFEILPPWLDPSELAAIRPLPVWLAMLPLAVLVLSIQVGTEELFFRGYLQQQLACLSARPLVWLLVPSLLFGLAHLGNGDDPLENALWVIWATLLGLACADLTARSGTLGAAIGLHLANNVFALVVAGEQDSPLSGLALFLYPPAGDDHPPHPLSMLTDPEVILELVFMCMVVLTMWLAARIALRR